MIIDFHTHAFPPKVAQLAIPKLAKESGGLKPQHDGTAPSLIEGIKAAGVSKAVVLNIATNPKQQTKVNDYAISLLEYPELIPFGSVHHDSEDVFFELERLKEAGIKGIKLHPDYQNFYVDDDKMIKIYEKISSLGLVTVFHSGLDLGFPYDIHCTPQRLLNIIDVFSAPVVAAHMGGVMFWYETYEKLAGTKIYLDTSFSYGVVPPQLAKSLIEKHTAQRILFGSDMPWSASGNEIVYIKSLDLSKTQEDLIFYKNACKLLNI
ncbi:MAG: amidohydrolase family protein [Oscillospiraceae bacterium]|jgi:predicted TIM-barrel fold metal-dependent hydrolase|nr:amidohydrolase family protein [Oscillospiraceae bacterium]